jgi:hypothetical protein
MKISVFSVVAPYSMVDIYQRFIIALMTEAV